MPAQLLMNWASLVVVATLAVSGCGPDTKDPGGGNGHNGGGNIHGVQPGNGSNPKLTDRYHRDSHPEGRHTHLRSHGGAKPARDGDPRAAAAMPSRPSYGYRFFDETRYMEIEPGQFAVLASGGSDDMEVREALESTSFILQDHETLEFEDWYLVEQPRAMASGGDGEAMTPRAQDLDVAHSSSLEYVTPVFRDGAGGVVLIRPEILVSFKDATDAEARTRLLATEGVDEVVADFAGTEGLYKVRTDLANGLEVLALANQLMDRRDELEMAVPDMIFTGRSNNVFTIGTPNDPDFDKCWALHNTGQYDGVPGVDLGATEAWAIETGDPDIIVVVLDSGVDLRHPDLNVRFGRNFTDDRLQQPGAPGNECDVHGTLVAGCVGAIKDNEAGGVGIAPGCSIASARIFKSRVGDDGSCAPQWVSSAAWTVQALAWAEQIGARVTINCNAYAIDHPAIELKYKQTRAAGMIHFAGTGNSGRNDVCFPSCLTSVNAVGGHDQRGKRAVYSNGTKANVGAGIQFVGPAACVHTTDRHHGYVLTEGTSFAAPYVAGVAALVLSKNPQLTPEQVEAILRDSCRHPGGRGVYDTTFGWGRVHAGRALKLTPDPAMRPTTTEHAPR